MSLRNQRGLQKRFKPKSYRQKKVRIKFKKKYNIILQFINLNDIIITIKMF